VSTYNATGKLSYVANGAIPKHARVVRAAGQKVGLAAIGSKDIGTAENMTTADGEDICVRSRNDVGTRKMIASKAIAENAAVFTAANGKISDVKGVGAWEIGHAETAATADGDIIEVAAYSPIVGAIGT
jgi:hypothetical protein